MPNYVKNPTWADGSGGNTPITAAKLNNMESGIFDAHYQAGCRVFHSANQNVNTSTVTVLAFDSESFDTESNASSTIHDTVTNNSRLTCRTAGIYLIAGSVDWQANATGYRAVNIRLNGTTVIGRSSQINSGASISPDQLVTTVASLAVNDYVEMTVFQDSGSTLTINFISGQSPQFSMIKVA